MIRSARALVLPLSGGRVRGLGQLLNDPLVEAGCRFLDEFLSILKEKCPGESDEPLEFAGRPRWIPQPDMGLGVRRFKAVPMFFTAEQQCAARILGELRPAGLQALEDLERALAADSVIGPRLGHEVSSSGAGGQTWQAPPMVQLLLDRAIGSAEGFDLGPSSRDAIATQWAEWLRRPSDRMTVIVALHEFYAPVVPILLEPGLEIDELSESEIAAALALGAGGVGLSVDERTVSRVFGIRTSFASQLFIDGIPAVEGEQEIAVRQKTRERAEFVLLALRVFKAGRVDTSGSFQYSVSWDSDVTPAGGTFGSLFGWHVGEPYVLADEEVIRFREFWVASQSAQTASPIEAALRRFGYASERSRPDDAIVDLLIAAETLFFSDITKADRGEFRFRLSVRVAMLLGEEPTECRRLAKFMRHAYDARSGIAHAGDAGAENLRSLEGERVTAAEHADVLKDVLRRALRAAIKMVASRQRFPPDWEELMFSGSSGTTSD